MEHSAGCGASGAGGGEGGQGKSPVPRKAQPSWLAGDRAGDCAARSPGGEQECACLRLAGAGGFLSSRVLFLARRHVGGRGERNVGVQWLPGASLCPYSKTTGSIRKNMKFPEDRESPEPNSLRKAWVWGELLALPP